MRKSPLLIALLLTTVFVYSQKPDEAVLKRVIQTEVQGWLDASGALAQQWHVTPTAGLMVSNVAAEEPWFFELRGDELGQWLKSEKKKQEGVKLTQSNHEIRMAGKVAWVTYDQQLAHPDGRIDHSREMKLLEKVKGEWKIVLGSAHFYKPEDGGR